MGPWAALQVFSGLWQGAEESRHKGIDFFVPMNGTKLIEIAG